MVQFFNSQFSPLPPYINVESGQVLLSKAQNFANNIDLEGEGFFAQKYIFYFVSTVLSKIVVAWPYFLKNKKIFFLT